MRTCVKCSKKLNTRHQIKFCSNQCQGDFKYQEYIASWKKGKDDGGRGIVARNLSGHVRRYLNEKFNHRCSSCGWNKKHSVTGVAPLEIDHIDGNAENNLEKNLRLLCPNCHALTPFFKNLNKGNGRKWRMDKYVKNN